MVMTVNSHSFTSLCNVLTHMFRTHSRPVKTEKWQGRPTKPEMETRELLNITVAVPLSGEPGADLEYWRRDIKPHLPWADNHFAERVGGEPLNPGNTYMDWRHGASAATFLEGAAKQFNHTYMERMWPKYAGKTPEGKVPLLGGVRDLPVSYENHGIRNSYGDLSDLVQLLAAEPYTRQAYLPLFFPEDTGIGDGGRKPCTLGYQFIMRDNRLHCYYPMRSCDFVNHFRDDCYLAVRLTMWVIEQCRACTRDPAEAERGYHSSPWDDVLPGSLTLHATSLHVFINDFNAMKGNDHG